MLRKIRSPKIVAVIILVILAGAGVSWKLCSSRTKTIYVPDGYGGYIAKRLWDVKALPDPLIPAVRDYNKGNYKAAEAAAQRVIDSASRSNKVYARQQVAKAQYILAFSAARQKNMTLARDRFADLREKASKLPDKGKMSTEPGVPSATLEEDAAYQHAVCTAALGDKKAAEAEYMKFLKDFPESSLINGAAARIERLHDGKMPPEAEAAWRKASEIALARQKERTKQQSQCAPECLTELLRRQGKKADVKELAAEMKTNETGTSLLALSKVAEKYGFKTEGLALTQKGLEKQPLPLIVVVQPGHYVIVDKITREEVTIWDPYGKGVDKPCSRTLTTDWWSHYWSGVGLVLKPVQPVNAM